MPLVPQRVFFPLLMQLPLEVLERIFFYCDTSDINAWKSIVPRRVYLCKKDHNVAMAAGRGNIRGLKYFMERDADFVDMALDWAAQMGQLESVRFFVENCFSLVSRMIRDALYSAYKGNYLEIVKYLLEKVPEHRDSVFSWTTRDGNEEMMAYFVGIEYGDFHQARRVAAARKHSNMLHVLFRKPIPLDPRCKTVLLYCIQHPDFPLFLRVVELGLDLDRHLEYLCLESAKEGNLDIWKFIVSDPELHWREQYGEESMGIWNWFDFCMKKKRYPTPH
jgi:hypothetical protein